MHIIPLLPAIFADLFLTARASRSSLGDPIHLLLLCSCPLSIVLTAVLDPQLHINLLVNAPLDLMTLSIFGKIYSHRLLQFLFVSNAERDCPCESMLFCLVIAVSMIY